MGQIAVSSGGVVFVWTLFVIGTTSFMSMLLRLHVDPAEGAASIASC